MFGLRVLVMVVEWRFEFLVLWLVRVCWCGFWLWVLILVVLLWGDVTGVCFGCVFLVYCIQQWHPTTWHPAMPTRWYPSMVLSNGTLPHGTQIWHLSMAPGRPWHLTLAPSNGTVIWHPGTQERQHQWHPGTAATSPKLRPNGTQQWHLTMAPCSRGAICMVNTSQSHPRIPCTNHTTSTHMAPSNGQHAAMAPNNGTQQWNLTTCHPAMAPYHGTWPHAT